VIGRHGQQDRIGAALGGHQRGQRQRRCGVTPGWLQDDGRGLTLEGTKLLGNQKAVIHIADDDGIEQMQRLARVLFRQTIESVRGRLQHGQRTRQRQELLGIGLAGQRPEPGSGAAGQDDGLQRHEIPT
jgi:hypothetical protein